MDIVYPFRGISDELRYSLRSLRNIPHNRVFLVGDKPDWVKNVIHLPTPKHQNKLWDSNHNIAIACFNDQLDDDFILMNDDFFIVEPLEEVPVFHRGNIRDTIRSFAGNRGPYVGGMVKAWRFLGDDALSYELHVPMYMNKQRYLEAFQIMEKNELPAGHIRTLYGNIFEVGGTEIKDVKINHSEDPIPEGPFISSIDKAFRPNTGLREHIESLFPGPSPYEYEG